MTDITDEELSELERKKATRLSLLDDMRAQAIRDERKTREQLGTARAEIEVLRKRVSGMTIGAVDAGHDLAEARSEIAQLKEENERITAERDHWKREWHGCEAFLTERDNKWLRAELARAEKVVEAASGESCRTCGQGYEEALAECDDETHVAFTTYRTPQSPPREGRKEGT